VTTAPLILIVEDTELSMKLERDVLELHGFRTLEARTAAQGIALALERLPDVVLMDIRLPDMDGVTALGCLRENPHTAGIPVLAVTASAMPRDIERFQIAGFDGYVGKPVNIRTFPETIRSYCRSTGSAAAAEV
jgi:two-component system cell cycle response regulator DivK